MYGHHFIQWVGSIFGACVYTPRDIIGFVFGMVNIVLWLFAQAPQLYKNYKNKTAESLSCTFLSLWLIGDITNFLGCILTAQPAVQLWTSIYFVFMDILTLTQWLYYRRYNARIAEEKAHMDTDDVDHYYGDDEVHSVNNSGSKKTLHVLLFAAFIVLSTPAAAPMLAQPVSHAVSASVAAVAAPFSSGPLAALWPASAADVPTAASAGARRLLAAEPAVPFAASDADTDAGFGTAGENDDPDSPGLCNGGTNVSSAAEMVGIVSAWISAVLYVGSRIPQIVHNYNRKSTDGLSLGLFLSSSLANVFYGMSILLPTTTDFLSEGFWKTTIAYLIGSLGTVLFGVIILFQMYKYRHNKAPEEDLSHSVSLFKRGDAVARSDHH
jgi:uncharacterized protein with PQ loop repeat